MKLAWNVLCITNFLQNKLASKRQLLKIQFFICNDSAYCTQCTVYRTQKVENIILVTSGPDVHHNNGSCVVGGGEGLFPLCFARRVPQSSQALVGFHLAGIEPQDNYGPNSRFPSDFF